MASVAKRTLGPFSGQRRLNSAMFLDFATFACNMGLSTHGALNLARVVLVSPSRMSALPNVDNTARRQSVPCAAPVMVDAGQFWCTGHGAEVSNEELTLADVRSPLAVGTGVDVYFELDGLLAIEARAVVTQAEEGRVTLRFLDLAPDTARELERYVSGGFQSSTHIRRYALAVD